MPFFPHFNLEKVFQNALEICRLAEEEEEKIELEEEIEKEEEIEDEEEEMEEEEEGEEEEEREEEVEEEKDEEEDEGETEDEEEREATDSDIMCSTLSASLKTTLPSFYPSPPSTFSSYPLFLDSLDEGEGSVSLMLRITQSYSFTSCSNLDEEDGSLEEESINTFKLACDDSLWQKLKEQKVTELVNLLILKYSMKELFEELEMLRVVTEDCRKQFPVIFEEASKCLEMIFGIDTKKNYSVSSTYVLTNSLNLTYDDNNQRLPRNGLLIVILGLIFIEGNCASEERVWEFLKMLGIYDGTDHFIYGEPREFSLEIWSSKIIWNIGKFPRVILYVMSSCGVQELALKLLR
ncbi:hypothetical protein HispidOSU_013714 [Sigmodon hispidus]